MPSAEFDKGFQHELANRAFALRAMEGIARRLHRDPQLPFWDGYAALERFNLPRYEKAASRWGLEARPGWWTRTRGAAIGATPKPLLGRLLKFAYPKTVAYRDELRRLRGIGPEDGKVFLDYMVDQEDLQVEMMQLALDRRYAEVTPAVDAFFLKYRDREVFGVLPSEVG